MAEDTRKGRNPNSDYVVIAGGDATPHEVIGIRSEETLSIDSLRIEYSNNASVEAEVTLYDESDYDGAADLTDDVDKFILSPGDRIVIEDATYSDITKSLAALAEGNSDDRIVISAGGVNVTG